MRGSVAIRVWLRRLLSSLALSGFLAAVPAAAQPLRPVAVASGISAPTDIQNAGDGSGRLFLVEQSGVIRILRDGALLPQPFLDIRSRVRSGGERGLLGLAFPPGFTGSGHFYVNYSNRDGDTVIAMFQVTSNPDIADPASELILKTIAQPFANHNGGQLAFGPDGYLYIGMGDGGSGGDPLNNGQRLDTLLGKLLRVDVERSRGQMLIPPDNPFVGASGVWPEIWAYGLRNPWRFSFDRESGDLWIGDVGQNSFEEVNRQPSASQGGENYGWRRMEGLHCFQAGCSANGLTLPVLEYGRNDGCSVTGGYVYRGQRYPGLGGAYIYGDYCSGRIWGLMPVGNRFENRLLLDSGFSITTFGQDEAGEIYVADAGSGIIYHLEGEEVPEPPVQPPPSFEAGNVVNAASFAPGLTPGSLATVFVEGVRAEAGITQAPGIPLPFTLDNVMVTLDGAAAPLLAIVNTNGHEQVNFQVPWDVAGRDSVAMVVTRGSLASEPVEVPVLAGQPAIFQGSDGMAIVVRNHDFSLVTAQEPLEAGDDVFFYAGGLGPVTNAPASGGASPASPLARAIGAVEVRIGGVMCEVQFAGLAPGLVGVYQVNIRVPEGLAGGNLDMVIATGPAESPAVPVPVR